MAEEAELYRHDLLETLSDYDESLMEKFLDDAEISPDEIAAAIRAGTIGGGLVPVLNGSAFKNKGVQALLDAVVDYLPSPSDVPAVAGTEPRSGAVVTRSPDDAAPLAALAFKIATDPHVGKLTYFRVYSGTLAKGSQVLNTRTGRKERIGRILEMHANDRVDLDSVASGDIAAAIGLKDCRTGDTLCDPAHGVALEDVTFPDPVIDVAVEPKSKADQDKMSKALTALSDEDPTFRVRTDAETAQTIIAGMGELHLEVLVDRMLREFNVQANVGKPQVAYRETLTAPVTNHTFVHKKQTGGSGQFAVVTATVEPNPGEPYAFESTIRAGAIPREYIKPVDDGIREAMSNGGARRIPDCRCEGHPHRRPHPRRGLLGDGLQDRRGRMVPGGGAQGPPGAARAGDVGGDRHPRRLSRRCGGRPQRSPRPGARHRAARQQPGDQRAGSAC